jgi:nucleotide-binding universal stress UspA family protein
LAAVSTSWLTTPRRGLIPPLGASASAQASGARSLGPGRVVALTDLSATATNAAWRAALVARDLGLPLHVVGMRAASVARRDAQLALQELTRELRQRLHINAHSTLAHANLRSELADTTRHAALLVVDATSGNRVANWLVGSLAQRVARRCRTPVLAVRRPALASYRRVIVSVDLDSHASGLIAAARALSRDHRMQVLHVLQDHDRARMLLADVPAEEIDRQRVEAADAARQMLTRLITAGEASHGTALPVTVFGHVPSEVLEQVHRSRTQLLVLGQPTRGALMDFVRGGVGRRVVPASHADVLLVPLALSRSATPAHALPGARPS